MASRLIDKIKALLFKIHGCKYWFINYKINSSKINPPFFNTGISVVMCTWKRPASLASTIEILEKQSVKINLYIWNNNKKIKGQIDSILREKHKINTWVFHGPKNIGGFGRFYLAKELNKLGLDKVVFIDDDQSFGPQFIQTLLDEYDPKKQICAHGFKFNNTHDYWAREEAHPGEEIDYGGTGGMICNAQLFQDSELEELPAKFWFIEDFWLNYIAKKNSHNLLKSKAKIEIERDGKDQSSSFLTVLNKNTFLKYLVTKKNYKLIGSSNNIPTTKLRQKTCLAR